MSPPCESINQECNETSSTSHFVDSSLETTITIGHPRCSVVHQIEDRLLRAGHLSSEAMQLDGEHFGNHTMLAIRNYEEVEWLISSEDRVLQSTLHALFSTEDIRPVLHGIDSITLHSQPDEATCWAACLASMLQMSVDEILDNTPVTSLIEGALRNNSDTHVLQGIPVFPKSTHRLVTFYPQSWTTESFANLVAAGPVMINALTDSLTYSAGYGSDGHCLIVVGVRGCRQPDGKRLVLRIWDPLPVGHGSAYSITYFNWMMNNPLATFRNTVREDTYVKWGGSGGEVMLGFYPL